MNDITIFSITNNRSSHGYSLKSILNCEGCHAVTIINNMKWIDALNTCISLCKTKYFIRLDDDMFLHPKSLLYINSKLSESFGLYYFYLWEDFTNNIKESIKIYNIGALKTIGGFKIDTVTNKVDKLTNASILNAGFNVIADSSIIAIHACCSWEEQLKYELLWGHKKATRDKMKQYSKTLEEQYNMRLSFLENINNTRRTKFGEFYL